MSYLPPLRTRHGTRTEPHISPDQREPATGPEQPEFQVSEPARAPTPAAAETTRDDDDYPVLTQVVAESPLPPAPPELADEQAEFDAQAAEDEMVDRITAHILDRLRPELEDLIAVAVREALQHRS